MSYRAIIKQKRLIYVEINILDTRNYRKSN